MQRSQRLRMRRLATATMVLFGVIGFSQNASTDGFKRCDADTKFLESDSDDCREYCEDANNADSICRGEFGSSCLDGQGIPHGWWMSNEGGQSYCNCRAECDVYVCDEECQTSTCYPVEGEDDCP